MQTSASRTATYVGLLVALFGRLITAHLLPLCFGPSQELALSVARDLTYFALLGSLLWLISSRERLPLTSIGLHGRTPWKSLLWGVVGFVLCWGAFGLSLLLDAALHLHVTQPDSDMPLWALTLTVLRAGVVEEVFYRGYAMERIKQLTGSTALAWIIPLGAFTSGHFYLGAAGMLNAGLMGAVLTGLYWWRRDLKANMLSHVLVDFVPLVLFQWLAR